MVKSKFQILILLFSTFLFISLFGCANMRANITEAAKCTAGISTKALEDGRKDAVKKQFKFDYKTCFEKVKAILAKRGSYIYAQDIKKHMIAVYVSEEDLTAVGVFFTEVDAKNTLIEVTSSSTYCKEAIANRIFVFLEGEEWSDLEKGQADAENEMGNK